VFVRRWASAIGVSAPFEADDLRALALALLGVGDLDPTADDVRTYARRLRTAGNLVELREFPAMRHGAAAGRTHCGCGSAKGSATCSP
jgi:acetyl esterase/lipase